MTESIKLTFFDQLGNSQSDGFNNQKKIRLNFYVSYRVIIAFNLCESIHFLGFCFYLQINCWIFFHFLLLSGNYSRQKTQDFARFFKIQEKIQKKNIFLGKASKIIQDRNVIAITDIINIRSRLWKELSSISSSRRFDILENTVQIIQQWVLFCQMTNLDNNC